MKNKKFRAYWVTEDAEKRYSQEILDREIDDLPPGDVLIKVSYSSLNYKDALSATGVKGVTRQYPHTPGIDAAGVVEESVDEQFQVGDRVLVTGYDLGMNTAGGLGEYIRVPAQWVAKLPEGLTEQKSMMYGTAGFTAALSVKRLIENGVRPEDGEILVTGATGGVGSIAVGFLSKLGYTVVAGTGKPETEEMLKKIGASAIALRDTLDDQSGKALLKERWAGVIDTVGGNILASAIKSTKYGGTVTSCGNAASAELSLTVFPFILRGVSLLGIDSVQCPMERRLDVWNLLAGSWELQDLEKSIEVISLEQVSEKIDLILKGRLVGRVVVKHK
ncbi:MAG: oxidoreductase [Firmicutes bacterium HGW-Firmicutes-11]|jgi:putative YhdH/YhfP family quinone oxidoreductase|nr:MAG: oxidoreductase [Firmicutes bacterium HGW-Firmicutes-11]